MNIASPGAPIRHVTTSPSPFSALGLIPALVSALEAEGYRDPTPIQCEAIGPAIAGADLLCCAQTGTGKTAAFVLPILQRLSASPRAGHVRALVLTPTRELAAQIGERTAAYGKHLNLKHAVIYGGVGQRAQEDAVRRRPDILIATPGRLLDLMQQGVISLHGIETLVLDEADRMLDMGFIHDVKRVLVKLPARKQTLFFSATMPPAARGLASELLRKPVEIAVTPKATTAETVRQSVYLVPRNDKRPMLERILRDEERGRVIVFTRTKHGANRLADQLLRAGIGAAAIHGNKSQGARERAIGGFRNGTTPVLVATDIAARGIDVDDVALVVNYELPNVPESYVHRIGRTGRAGKGGRAIAFCDETERGLLTDIEHFLRARIPRAEATGERHHAAPPATRAPVSTQQREPTPLVTGVAPTVTQTSGNGPMPRAATSGGPRTFRARQKRRYA